MLLTIDLLEVLYCSISSLFLRALRACRHRVGRRSHFFAKETRMMKRLLGSMYRLNRATLGFLITSMIFSTPVYAMKFSPIEMTFTPSGRESVRTFRLENDTDEPIAVEVSVFSRAMTPDGGDELEPAEDDFVVVPQQMVLDTGDVQWIRVQWIGNPSPDQEMAFRLIAEQLPIDIGNEPEAEGGVIRLLVRYLASVYVVPKDAEANISIASSALVERPENGPELIVDLVNKGTAHEVLDELQLTVNSAAGSVHKKIHLSAEELTELGGRNILAGATRRFKLDWPEGLPEGPVVVTLEASD